MTEALNTSPEAARAPMSEAELMALGELCMPENIEADLGQVASSHAQLLAQPNSATAPSMFAEGDIATSEGFAYRQVGREAIEDLAASGVVRNGATAQGEEHRRWGHRVFWHAGQEGRAVNTGGRFIIEAPMDAVQSGWVTADKVSANFAQRPEGEVKNILPKS